MTLTANMYGPVLLSAFNGEINLTSDTIKCLLVSSAYTPNQDTHRYLSSVVANEVAGSGYTAGGQTLTTKTITLDGPTNTVKFDAADVVWSAVTFTTAPRYAIFYDATPSTDATRPLIAYWDFGADASSSGSSFTLQLGAAGIFSAPYV